LRWYYHASSILCLNGNQSIVHYLDNQSVIKRIDNALHMQNTYPNRRLLPEQDVIDEIVATIRQLPTEIKITWVKGHQDDGQDYSQLPLPAQLNCDADHLAMLAAKENTEQMTSVIPLPQTPATLLLGNNSITSHIKLRVREAASTPDLHRYLCTKYKWENNVIHMIDWTNYRHILPKYYNTRTTLVKHLHSISPTGHIAHRNNPHLPHHCPACAHEFEDNNHVVRCPHASRAAWRSQTIQLLSTYQNGLSDPNLLDILRDGITRFHWQLPPPVLDHYPLRYHSLLTTQTSIGWDQLYRGRWSLEWSRLQEEHQRLQGKNYQATSWLLGLSRLLIDQWFLVWDLRNKQRHGNDQSQHSKLRAQIIYSQMQELYALRQHVLPCDQSIFYESMEAHLFQSSLDALESWINTYQNAIHASTEHALQRGRLQNRILVEFPAFNPIAQARQQVDSVDLPSC
jgi:hypothetical protein